MRRTLILILGVLILGLLVGIWIGIEIGARSEEQGPWPEDEGISIANRFGEQKPWLQLGEPKPWPQEEVLYFELLVFPDGEKSPIIGWNDGEGGIMFLHDVELSYPDWSITFALYDRECLLGDPGRIFMTDPGRFRECGVKEARTVHWDFLKSEIIELWGEQWQILRVIDHTGRLDDGQSWETNYLVIMRWIR